MQILKDFSIESLNYENEVIKKYYINSRYFTKRKIMQFNNNWKLLAISRSDFTINFFSWKPFFWALIFSTISVAKLALISKLVFRLAK